MKIGNFGIAALVAGLLASTGHVAAHPNQNLEAKLSQPQPQKNNQFKNQAFLDLRAKVKELEQKYRREDPSASDLSYWVGLEVKDKVLDYINSLGISVDLMPEPSIFSFDESIVIDNAFCPDMSCTRGVDETKIHNTNYIRLNEKEVVVEHFYHAYEKGRLPFRFDRHKIVQQNGQTYAVIDQVISDELQISHLDNFDFWATYYRVADFLRMNKENRDEHKGQYIWRELSKIMEYFMLRCGIEGSSKSIDVYENMIRIGAGYTMGYGVDPRRWIHGTGSLVIFPDGTANKSVNLNRDGVLNQELFPGTNQFNRKPVSDWKTTKINLATDCQIKY